MVVEHSYSRGQHAVSVTSSEGGAEGREKSLSSLGEHISAAASPTDTSGTPVSHLVPRRITPLVDDMGYHTLAETGHRANDKDISLSDINLQRYYHEGMIEVVVWRRACNIQV